MFTSIDDLDPAATLARAGAVVGERRAAELEDLMLVARWADLHSSDPRRGPAGRRSWAGEDRLVQIGGDGTPEVQELCLPELAIARRVHSLAVRSAMADVLDLRHRLPLIWEQLQTGGGEIWVARKVAAMSRHLDRFEVNVVDAGVADALAGESPSRVLRIAQAKVIEADQVGYRGRLETELRKRYVGLSRTDEHGLRHVIARVEAGDAAWIDVMVDRVADALARRRDLIPDVPAEATKSELRSVAFGWLAHPERVVDLLADAARDSLRPTAILYVHLHQAALDGGSTGAWPGVKGSDPSSWSRCAACSAMRESSSSP